MSKFLTSHWWATFFVLFFPLAVMYGYADFIRESELNARVGWLLMIGGFAYLFRHSILQKFFLAILIAFVISGALDILYAVTFGGVFMSASLEALVYTDSKEGFEFALAYIGLENTLLLSVYLVLSYVALRQVVFQSAASRTQKTLVVLGVLMLVFALQQFDQRGRFFEVVPGFAGVAMDFPKNRQSLEEVIAERKKRYETADFSATKVIEDPQTYVIVIGESLNRNHMSLYGYARETTPNLDKLAAESIVFKDVVTAYAQTRPSLSVSLTSASHAQLNEAQTALSLMEVFKKAGFKTWWISNQQPLRYPTSAIAAIADQSHFISHDFHGVEAYRYDGYMTPYIEKAMEDTAKHKVIFVHMMGSHLHYRSKYPADQFEVFTDDKGIQAYTDKLSKSQISDINAYDNSVLYSDFLLGSWINKLKQSQAISGLLFFADHGEEVFDSKDFKGHGPDGVTRHMLEIPLIFWRNQSYQDTFSNVDKTVYEQRNQSVMLDDLFHLTLCLSRVESNLYDANRALCTPNHQPKPRIIYGKPYEDYLK